MYSVSSSHTTKAVIGTNMAALLSLFLLLGFVTSIHATAAKQVLQHRQTRELKEEDLLELSRFLQSIQEQETEDVFRRLQQAPTGSSFLNEHLSHATNGGSNGHYYYYYGSGSTTHSSTSSTAGQAYSVAADFAMPQAHGKPPRSGKSRNRGDGSGMTSYHQDESYGGVPGYYGSSNGKGKSKSGKSSKAEKSKKHKKAKKHRCEYVSAWIGGWRRASDTFIGVRFLRLLCLHSHHWFSLLLDLHSIVAAEKKNIDKKLAKDGYFDDDYWEYYDDYDQVYQDAEDEWHYNDWAWEYDEEYLEEEEDYHHASSSWIYEKEGSYYRAGGGVDGSLGSNLNRFGPSNTAEEIPPHSAIAPPDPTTDSPQDFSELVYSDDYFDDGNSTDDYFDFDDIRPQARAFGDFADGARTKQLQLPKQEFLPQMDHDGPPMRFQFPFPTIEHRVYSGPVLLKAHSATDLSELDPEIFAVLQSVLTPYLQDVVGTTLKAYTLEVDYTPGDDKFAAGTIVTNLQVTVTLKVVSDSITSLTAIDHTQVSEWIHDFFVGPELNTFLVALQNNNINVREIVFIDQEFKAGGQVIAGISGGSGSGGKKPSNTENSGGGGSTAVIVITVCTLTVGAVLFLHFTGRLPSKEQMHNFGENSKERMHAFGHTLKDKIRRNDRDDDVGDPLEDMHNDEEGGRKQRERTWSGTFRRYPEGGIRPAAIQKKPALSQDYLGDSSSKGSSSSSSSSSGPPVTRKDWKKAQTTEVSAVYDDYSFSVGGDFGITNSPITPSRSDRRHHNPTSPAGSDEFTMPEEYDTVHEEETASLYSKWSHSVNQFPRGHQQQVHRHGTYDGMSPLPPSPRRVTPSDIASPYGNGGGGGGASTTWSLGSFDLQTPSARQLYRDFMGSADAGSATGSATSSDKSKSPKSKFGLNIPKFT